ncbi:ABC transporter substrate-binding protein [Deinococcus maricopensis]|uniref:ABC transporter substrate-binding protein n=1 Tax=Deinococcus maricopensis (strain DSM 21211 / LMG 22137 / NRRL B-23946 / LB-34) TaxID=709986 RepID=E8U7E4_DEIML|nr:ABC transporter substrate-binding protein [Deinococcus maricopensis]ADV66983.1 ABC transporter substrate-binding protein [Deinococcus maricopensis DSM 21211]
MPARSPHLLAAALILSASVAQAQPMTFNAAFVRMNVEGNVVLKVGNAEVPVVLQGIALGIGADGALNRMLPASLIMKVVVKEKSGPGKLPKVVLFKGPTNINEALVSQGYATRQ